jgi:hypothetical protein
MSGIKEVELNLTEEQKTALASLKSKLPEEAKGTRDYILYRFLNQHYFDVDKTLAAYVKYLAWRKENKVDSYTERKVKNLDKMRKLIPYGYIGFDVEGRPVYYERTGKMHPHALLKHVAWEDMLESHIWGFEYLTKQMEEESKRRGQRIETITCVIDLEGLSLAHRVAIPWLHKAAVFDQEYYPGIVGKVIIINSPWVWPVFFNLVKGFFPLDVQNRIEVVSDPKTELPQIIPRQYLPPEYGGEAKDFVPILDAKELLTDEDEGLDVKNVPAGGTFTKDLKCDKDGGVFTWYFISEGDYDIDFSAKIVFPDGKTSWAKINSRCTSNKGAYTADGPCTVVFTWDNSFSWLNSKNIRYYVSVGDKLNLHNLEASK